MIWTCVASGCLVLGMLVLCIAAVLLGLDRWNRPRCPIHGVRMSRDEDGELRCPEVPCVFGEIEERR